MSGIVGGAGSKSGIIGSTEIGYETGDWTPIDSAGNLSNAQGSYVRIGNFVHCQCWIQADGPTTTDGFTGYPFVHSVEHASAGYGFGTVTYQDNAADQVWALHANPSNFTFRRGATKKGLTAGNQAHFAFNYYTSGVKA